MRIAFDQQVFLLQEYGGISRYICSLAQDLSLIPGATTKILAPLHFSRHLEQIPNKGLVWGRRVPRLPKSFRLTCSLSKGLAQAAIKFFRPDIVHETYYSSDKFLDTKAIRVLTVYDMIHERYASMFDRSDVTTTAKKIAAARADHVICISENTRRDLLELFNVPEHKVSVVYLGHDLHAPTDAPQSMASETSQSPFLLYVGSRHGYKNFDRLLHAVASSHFLRSNFSIICFGGGNFSRSEISLMSELGLETGKVLHINGADKVLAQLYKKAEALIYPSLYEGFGLPLLEAMSFGCPVVCSNTSSLPEVVGDAGELFYPDSIESIRIAIESVVRSRARREELIQKGRTRCVLFSWNRCASETMSIYRRLT